MLEISIIVTRALTREQAYAMRGVLTFLARGIPKSETFWGPTTSDVLEMINKFLEKGAGVIDCQHWMTFEQPNVKHWIPHDGKGCPVPPETLVRIRCASGLEFEAEVAGDWNWGLAGTIAAITHYMIVEE